MCLAADAKSQRSLTISVPATVRSDAPIDVDITVKNISRRPQPNGIPVRTVECYYDIIVRDDNGKEPPLTVYGENMARTHLCINLGSVVMGELPAGASFHESFPLGRLYKLAPGKYTLQIGTLPNYYWGDVKSNLVNFAVLP
jgi:hypothetical protein